MKSREESAHSILSMVLGHAIRKSAHKIRFVGSDNEKHKHLVVSILGDDEQQWQVMAKMPDYAREPIFEELRRFSRATQAHDFELQMPYFGVKVQWHLTFDFAPDEAGNQSAIIALEPPACGEEGFLDYQIFTSQP